MEVDLSKTVAFAVTDPELITIHPDQIAAAGIARRLEEAKNRPAVDPAEQLRGEYNDLSRRLFGPDEHGGLTRPFPTEQAWLNEAESKKNTWNGAIKKLQDEHDYLLSLESSPGATKCRALREGRENVNPRTGQVMEGCGCDAHVLRRKRTAVEIQIRRAKNELDKSQRICLGNARDAAERDKLLPRWQELDRIFRQIDKARQVARGLANHDLAPQPIAQGDSFRSRHIRWEHNTPHAK